MRNLGELQWFTAEMAVILLFVTIFTVNGVSVDKQLTLTLSEKNILDKFKEEMLPHLTHDWMKKEIYLVRWLRARDFNLGSAKEMLQKNLEWRKENNIDGVLNEDFGSFAKQFSHIFEGHDKEGRPIFITNIGEWDVRKAVASGQIGRLRRLIYQGFEKVSLIVRNLQNKGKPVTQYYHIYNLQGFNMYQHGCSQCIGLALDAVGIHDNYYPGFAHRIAFLNTPQVFIPILEIFKAAARPESRDAIVVLGTNRKQWEARLLQDIDKDQLVAELGGNLVYDFQDY